MAFQLHSHYTPILLSFTHTPIARRLTNEWHLLLNIQTMIDVRKVLNQLSQNLNSEHAYSFSRAQKFLVRIDHIV